MKANSEKRVAFADLTQWNPMKSTKGGHSEKSTTVVISPKTSTAGIVVVVMIAVWSATNAMKANSEKRVAFADSDKDKVATDGQHEFVDRRLRGSCGRKYWTNRGYTKGVKCTKYKFSYYGCSDSQCRYCTKNTWTLDRLSDSFRDKINC